MKTLRLNRAESTAYTNGERRFWRAMRKQPYCPRGWWRAHDGYWTYSSRYMNKIDDAARRINCPYGQPGDLFKLSGGEVVEGVFMIAKITVALLDGRWGWVVEVGA